MRNRVTSNFIETPTRSTQEPKSSKKMESPDKQLWQGYKSLAQSSSEQGIKQFLSTMRRNGSFQMVDSQVRPAMTENEQFNIEIPNNKSMLKINDIPQFTPLMKKVPSKNQTTYDILNQIYELQNRKHRNQSLLEELMRKTRKQGGDIFSFSKVMHRKRYVKRSQRCQSVAQKEQELDQMKGQLIQVRAVVVQYAPKESTPKPIAEKLQPLPKPIPESSPEKDKKRITPPVRKKKIVVDESKFWDAGFNKIIQNPSYLEINSLINFSNYLQVIAAQHQKYYKLYVGRGNNHMLVKGMFNLRPNWTLCNSLDDDSDVNFIWTQKYTEMNPSEIKPIKKEILSEMVNDGFLDSTDLGLLKIAWDKVEGKTKKKIAEYNIDSQVIINNLNLVKDLQTINHQNQILTIQNHLKEGNQLGDKKNLFQNIQRYCTEWDIDMQVLIPLTYHINSIQDDEFQNFQQTFQHLSQDKDLKNIWIIKPGEDTNRGNGIKVTILQKSRITFKVSKDTHILCRSIQKIHFSIKKGNLIQDAIVQLLQQMELKKLIVFWYKKGYIRTSSSYFSLDNLESTKIHLTNDAIQNRMNGYGKFEKGNKVSYEQFQNYILEWNKNNNTNFNFDDLYQSMKNLTKTAAGASIHKIQNSDQLVGFELYGIDFMVTHDFKPILIEFNTNPCIECGCPVLTKIISGLMENLMRFVIDPLYPSKRVGNDDFNSKNDFELLLQC